MNSLRTSLGIVFPALLLVSTQVFAAEFTLRIHHFLGDDSLPHKGLIEPWARRVEAESDGRIEVKIYPKMALGGKTDKLVDQVVDGTVDIVWTAAAYTPNRFPHAEVFTLPLVHEGDPAATPSVATPTQAGGADRRGSREERITRRAAGCRAEIAAGIDRVHVFCEDSTPVLPSEMPAGCGGRSPAARCAVQPGPRVDRGSTTSPFSPDPSLAPPRVPASIPQ